MRTFFLACACLFFIGLYFFQVGGQDEESAAKILGRNPTYFDQQPSTITNADHPLPKTSDERDLMAHLPFVDVEEVFQGPMGLTYRTFDQLEYEPELLTQIRKEIEDFKQHGSSGNMLVTWQFSATEDLKNVLNQKGLYTLLHGLAFEPVQLTRLVDPGLKLVGAEDHNKLIPSKGWTGFVQSLEDTSSGRGVEFSETQLETQLGDSEVIIEEFLNDRVGDVRASVQVMKDDQGRMVHSIEWAEGERTFKLHTRLISREESLSLAGQILAQYRSLPYQGWKTPFVLDPNIPLHRLAIQRQQKLGPSGLDQQERR
jgi:hypothetical protein